MPWTPERSTINQTLQFGVETTPGVNVAANKLIQCFAVTFGPMADVAQFSATGRKYPSIVIMASSTRLPVSVVLPPPSSHLAHHSPPSSGHSARP